MTSFWLRIIAAVTMLIDHIAYVLIPYSSAYYMPMRIIGRLSFPIFCFLIAEGFMHTRSLKKYLLRLGILAIVSEIPFNLAFYRDVLDSRSRNVFFTLTLGLLALTAAGRLGLFILEKLNLKASLCKSHAMQMLAASPVIALLCWAADYIHCDYGAYGVLLICAFYLFSSNRIAAVCALAAVTLWKYGLEIDTIPLFEIHIAKQVQQYAIVSALPLLIYNKKPGTARFKEAFYVFYPVHLICLWIIYLIVK